MASSDGDEDACAVIIAALPIVDQLNALRDNARQDTTQLRLILPTLPINDDEEAADLMVDNVIYAFHFFTNIQKVVFMTDGLLGYCPVRLLIYAMQQQRNHLDTILFHRVAITGDWQGFQDMATEFLRLQKLENFGLRLCLVLQEDHITNGGDADTAQQLRQLSTTLDASASSFLDCVVRNVATLPSIRDIVVHGCRVKRGPRDDEFDMDVLHVSTVQHLCQTAKKLEQLILTGMKLNLDYVKSVFEYVEKAGTLPSLMIDLPVAPPSAPTVLSRFIQDGTSLKRLSFFTWRESNKSSASNGEGADAASSSQKKMELEFYNNLLTAIQNCSLDTLLLLLPEVTPRFMSDFRTMLSGQYSLTCTSLRADVAGADEIHDPEIEFYLKTNRLERKHLIHDNYPPGHSQESFLILTLAKASHDLSCLYYFLRMKPAIICDAGLSSSKDATKPPAPRPASAIKRKRSLETSDDSRRHVVNKQMKCSS